MYNCLFTFRSVTAAQHGAAVLDRVGIRNQFARTPKSISVKGCGYCLKVRDRDCMEAAQVLRRAEAAVSAAYRLNANGVPEAKLL